MDGFSTKPQCVVWRVFIVVGHGLLCSYDLLPPYQFHKNQGCQYLESMTQKVTASTCISNLFSPKRIPPPWVNLDERGWFLQVRRSCHRSFCLSPSRLPSHPLAARAENLLRLKVRLAWHEPGLQVTGGQTSPYIAHNITTSGDPTAMGREREGEIKTLASNIIYNNHVSM